MQCRHDRRLRPDGNGHIRRWALLCDRFPRRICLSNTRLSNMRRRRYHRRLRRLRQCLSNMPFLRLRRCNTRPYTHLRQCRQPRLSPRQWRRHRRHRRHRPLRLSLCMHSQCLCNSRLHRCRSSRIPRQFRFHHPMYHCDNPRPRCPIRRQRQMRPLQNQRPLPKSFHNDEPRKEVRPF